MARTPSASFSRAGLSPFKRSAAGFSVFDLGDPTQEAYYEFSKVNVKWQAGLATDAEYLTALQTYADSFSTDTAEYVNAQDRVRQAKYDIARNNIVDGINRGTKTYNDLLAFDQQAMTGVGPGSQQYLQYRANVESDVSKGAADAFNKVRDQWNAGKVTDAAYLDAFQTYVNKLTNPDDKASAQLNLDATRYTLARNAIVTGVNKGTRSINDLLTFDQASIAAGVVPQSDEYRTRLGRLQETQRAVFSDQEQEVHDKWSQGVMTSAQLLKWYQDAQGGSLAAGNHDLQVSIQNQIDSLQLRVQDEKDTKVVDDFNAGHMSANAFLAYARDARDRYAQNTPQYRDWDQRIQDAAQKTTEENMLYRYNLSQQYEQLQQFNQTHNKAPWQGGYTSNSTRWVYGADGQWHVENNTTTTPYTPTADQIKSWQETQATVEANKKQMRYIETQIGLVPGGWVNNQQLLTYYQNVQGTYTAGSTEWYQLQDRIDAVHQSMAQEQVWKTIGITVSYPGTPNDPQHLPDTTGQGPVGNKKWANAPGYHPAAGAPAPGSGITIDEFLWALGRHESGGNYTAQNSTTGAYGKYQHLPQYWPSRAARWLGNANAPMTPENQEYVTRKMVQQLYSQLGDWRLVALAWHNGSVSSRNPADWSVRNQKYVQRTMQLLGSDMWSPTTTQGVYKSDWTAGGGTPNYKPPPNPWSSPGTTKGGGTPAAPGTPGAPGTGTPPPSGASNYGQPTLLGTGPKFLEEVDPTTGKIVHVGIPSSVSDNPDGTASNFEDFYRAFNQAYKGNQSSFVYIDNGRLVTYYIPPDPNQRKSMQSALDQSRIQLYTAQSYAYSSVGDNDSARIANSNLRGAYLDTGDNLLIALNTGTRQDQNPKNAQANKNLRGLGEGASQVGQPGNVPNPMVTAKSLVDNLQQYMNHMSDLAQAAMDRGDPFSAYAFAKQAQQHYATSAVQINSALANAQSNIGQIQAVYGTPTTSIQSDLDKLGQWTTTINTSHIETLITDLVGDGKGKTGFFVTNPDGSPMVNKSNGQFYLQPDYRQVLQPNGTIRVESFTPPPPGSTNDTDQAISIKVNGNLTTVWGQKKKDTVGQFSDGTTIQGNYVYDSSTNSYWYENPFNPGHWSKYQYNYNLPKGVTAAVDPQSGQTYLQFTDQQTGVLYHLQLNDTGKYFVGQWDPHANNGNGGYVAGTTFDPTSQGQSVLGILSNAGVTRDTASIPTTDKMFIDVSGPQFGFKNADEWWLTVVRSPDFTKYYGDASHDSFQPQFQTPPPVPKTSPTTKALPQNLVNARLGLPPVQVPRISATTGLRTDLPQAPAANQVAYNPSTMTVNPYVGFVVPKVTTPAADTSRQLDQMNKAKLAQQQAQQLAQQQAAARAAASRPIENSLLLDAKRTAAARRASTPQVSPPPVKPLATRPAPKPSVVTQPKIAQLTKAGIF